MPEPIVCGSLLRIAQNAVGFGGFFEFFLGVLVARIAVGVILQRPLAIGGLHHPIVRVADDPEDLVIIAFGYAHLGCGWTATLTIAGRSSRPLKLYPL